MAYTCPICGATSHNPNDAAHRYCGACHTFADDVSLDETWAWAFGGGVFTPTEDETHPHPQTSEPDQQP